MAAKGIQRTERNSFYFGMALGALVSLGFMTAGSVARIFRVGTRENYAQMRDLERTVEVSEYKLALADGAYLDSIAFLLDGKGNPSLKRSPVLSNDLDSLRDDANVRLERARATPEVIDYEALEASNEKTYLDIGLAGVVVGLSSIFGLVGYGFMRSLSTAKKRRT